MLLMIKNLMILMKQWTFLEKEIGESIQSEEAKEGISAFLEKRPPNWK